jgi:hypothetical protein
MNPSDIRTEILNFCEAFALAAQTGNKIVIEATGEVVKAKVLELIPDNTKSCDPTL